MPTLPDDSSKQAEDTTYIYLVLEPKATSELEKINVTILEQLTLDELLRLWVIQQQWLLAFDKDEQFQEEVSKKMRQDLSELPKTMPAPVKSQMSKQEKEQYGKRLEIWNSEDENLFNDIPKQADPNFKRQASLELEKQINTREAEGGKAELRKIKCLFSIPSDPIPEEMTKKKADEVSKNDSDIIIKLLKKYCFYADSDSKTKCHFDLGANDRLSRDIRRLTSGLPKRSLITPFLHIIRGQNTRKKGLKNRQLVFDFMEEIGKYAAKKNVSLDTFKKGAFLCEQSKVIYEKVSALASKVGGLFEDQVKKTIAKYQNRQLVFDFMEEIGKYAAKKNVSFDTFKKGALVFQQSKTIYDKVSVLASKAGILFEYQLKKTVAKYQLIRAFETYTAYSPKHGPNQSNHISSRFRLFMTGKWNHHYVRFIRELLDGLYKKGLENVSLERDVLYPLVKHFGEQKYLYKGRLFHQVAEIVKKNEIGGGDFDAMFNFLSKVYKKLSSESSSVDEVNLNQEKTNSP